MSEYTEQELQSICKELASAIPDAPYSVTYDGVSTSDMFNIHVKINWPRWYRHPDEYGGDTNYELNKKIAIIGQWEDRVWNAINKIEKKYGLTVDMSA